METIKELQDFLWAVFNNWAGYTTGGVIVALVSLWSTLKQKTIPRKLGVVLGVIFLFLAFFNAWRDQRHSAMDTQKQVDYLSRPEFVVESENQASSCSNALTTIFLAVRITNHGTDSAVLDYEAHFQSKTTPSIKAKTVAPGLVGSLKLRYPNGQWYEIPPSGLLYNRTGVIHRGDYIAGRLPLEIPGNHCDELMDPGTYITIRVKDYLGNWFSGYFQGTSKNASQGPALMQGEPIPIPTEEPNKNKVNPEH